MVSIAASFGEDRVVWSGLSITGAKYSDVWQHDVFNAPHLFQWVWGL